MKKIIYIMIAMLSSSNCLAQLSLLIGGGGGINYSNRNVYTKSHGSYPISDYHEVYNRIGINLSAELGVSYEMKRHFLSFKVNYMNCEVKKNAHFYEIPSDEDPNKFLPFPSTQIKGNLENTSTTEKLNYIQLPILYGYSIVSNLKKHFTLTPYLGWVNQFGLNTSVLYFGSVQAGMRIQYSYFYIDVSDMIRVTERRTIGGGFNKVNMMLGVSLPLKRKKTQGNEEK